MTLLPCKPFRKEPSFPELLSAGQTSFVLKGWVQHGHFSQEKIQANKTQNPSPKNHYSIEKCVYGRNMYLHPSSIWL